MNEYNLKPNSARTTQELRENGRKGGVKSAEVRKERKTFKELINIALQEKDTDTGQDNAVAIVASLINKAKQGDNKAFEILRDTVGEKPSDKKDIGFDFDLTQLVVREIADAADTDKIEDEKQ